MSALLERLQTALSRARQSSCCCSLFAQTSATVASAPTPLRYQKI